MATPQKPTRTTIAGQDWECNLSPSPQRLLTGDHLTLMVTLSNPEIGTLTKDQHKFFEYAFSADDPRISSWLQKLKQDYNPKGWKPSDGLPRLPDGHYSISVEVTKKNTISEVAFENAGLPPLPASGLIGSTTLDVVNQAREVQASVTLQRAASFPTDDQALWVAIRNRTQALEFSRYQRFIERIFCKDFDVSRLISDENPRSNPLRNFLDLEDNRPLSIYGPYAYNVLKLATQVFLTLECGVFIRDGKQEGHTAFGQERLFDIEKERIRLGDPSISIDGLNARLTHYLIQHGQSSVLPYLKRIVTALVGLDTEDFKEVLPYCYGVLQHRLSCPSMLELIWSYWHEEGMLVQTMNALALRFQNRRSSPHDPLGEFELDPVRPLGGIIWGHIQEEHNRLTVARRASEYDHQYGLKLVGKAVASLHSADSRSKFIEGFHNLLYRWKIFNGEDADTTVIADAFPLLNALKEVHLVLAEGAHNQFGDLPWTARGEMLMTQWILARPEMREFLRGRYMVPYQEPWMGAVDSMKKLQGWTDTTVTHFHELAVTGERILLSIRYGDWSDINNIEEQAKNWARYWKPDIQRYLHALQAVTSVDYTANTTDSRDASLRFMQPSALLQRRLEAQAGQTASQRPQSVSRLTRQTASGFSSYPELPMQTTTRVLRYKKDE